MKSSKRVLIEAMEPRTLMSYTLSNLGDFTRTGPFPTEASDVVMDSHGNLYGITQFSGTNHDGSVFEVAAGSGTVTTLVSLDNSTGAGQGGLAIDSSGDLFGMTGNGGANGRGTVYEVVAGSGTTTVLASFDSTSGYAISPGASLIVDSHGNLYGTTEISGPSGSGSVFEVVAGSGVVTPLAGLGGSAGQYDDCALTMDSSGNLYGATEVGGANGNGAVFEVDTSNDTISALAPLNSSGGSLSNLIVDSSGNAFGVTYQSGSNNDGSVFEVVAGSGTLTTLASFNGSNGQFPVGSVATDSSGNLYGVTQDGGANSIGNVFEFSPADNTITDLADFNAGNLGYLPRFGVIRDSAGNLYGTTQTGGSNDAGTVFEAAAPLVTPATQAVITLQPTSITAGTTQTVAVSLEAGDGSVDTNNTSTVTLSISSGPTGATLGGTLSEPAVNGVATFSDLTFDTAGSYVLTASSSFAPVDSTQIDVVAGSYSQTVISSPSSSVQAGQSLGTVQVTAEDAFGNPINSFGQDAIVQLVPSDANSQAVLQGTLSEPLVNGVATFTDLQVDTVGDYQLLGATTISSDTTLSNSFSITPAAADHLLFEQQPTDAMAGQTIGPVELQVEDAFGNLVTTDNSTVDLTAGSPNALLGTTSGSFSGGVAMFSDLNITKAGQRYTIGAADPNLPTVTSNQFDISPLAADHLAFLQQPTDGVAGQTMNPVVVCAEDVYGNVVGDNSTVSVAAGTPNKLQGTASGSLASGTATFTPLHITQAGNYTMTANDGSLTPATSSSFNINPAAAAKLAITQQPASASAGQTLGSVTVNVEDTYGNLVPSDSSTVSATTGDGTPLGGTLSAAASGGMAAFNDLSITRTGAYALTFSDGNLTPATSATFSVSPGAAAKLAFVEQPTTGTSNQKLGAISVAIEDAYGNLVVGDSSTVTISPQAIGGISPVESLAGTTTVAAVNGVARFDSVSYPEGTIVLQASDAGLAQANSRAITVSAPDPTPTPTPTPTPVPDSVVVAGNALAPMNIGTSTVFGRSATGLKHLTVRVFSTSTPDTAILTENVSVRRGLAQFGKVNVKQAGDYMVQISDTLGDVMTQTLSVVPAAPTRLAFATEPAALDGRSAFSVRAVDQYGNLSAADDGNVVTVKLGHWHLSQNPTLSGTLSAPLVNGTATFSDVALDPGDGARLIATASGLHGARSGFLTNE